MPTLSILLFLWLVTIDAFATARRVDQLPGECAGRSQSYLAGRQLMTWMRCITVAALGVLALQGYAIAFATFALGVVYQALGIAVLVKRQFHAGFEAARGHCPQILSSAVGFTWIALTRGLPLYLIHWSVVGWR